MRTQPNSVLAIDPGTRHLGFASFLGKELEDFGVRDTRYVSGAQDIFASVNIIVNRLIVQKRPRVLILEKNNFSQIRQNLGLMLAIGEVKKAARRYRIRCFDMDPRTIRKVVCQNGNATKRDLAKVVSVRYPQTVPYLESNRRWRERFYQNSFDAIGVGLAFIATSRTLTTLRRSPRTLSKPGK